MNEQMDFPSFSINQLWFHIMQQQIWDGIIAKIGETAWAVYCVIKSHANLNSGEATPGIPRIAKLINKSEDTVHRALKVLIEESLITVEKRGRKNQYTLTEQLPILTDAGEAWGMASRQYVPVQQQSFIKEVMDHLEKDIPLKDKNINITFNIQNIYQGENGTVTMNVQSVQVTDDQNKPLLPADAVRQRLLKMKYAGS